MNRFAILSSAVALAAAPVFAAPVVDGVKSAGEWDSPYYSIVRDSFINGSSDANGYVRSTRRVSWDADYVYVSFEADTVDQSNVPTYAATSAGFNAQQSSTPTGANGNILWSNRSGPFVNLYLFSSNVNGQQPLNTPGLYGDLDDVIIESNTQWGFGNNAGIIPGTATPLVAQGGNVWADVTNGVFVGFAGGSSNFYEAAIDRDLVDFDDYQTLRVGGQSWAYGFTYGTFNTAVPEPTSLAVIGVGAAAMLMRRRRSTAC
jgi:hypothetical protein